MYKGYFISTSGIFDLCGRVAGMVTPKGSLPTEGETLQVSVCNQVPATQCNIFGRNLITGLTSAASPGVDISSTCKVGQKLGVSLPLLTCPLRRDHPGYCTAEVGNPGGTYELLCICLCDVNCVRSI